MFDLTARNCSEKARRVVVGVVRFSLTSRSQTLALVLEASPRVGYTTEFSLNILATPLLLRYQGEFLLVRS